MRRTLLALVAALILLGAGAQGAPALTNGNAPSSAMAPIATGIKCTPLQGQLANQAAAGWNSMALAAGERLPTNGCDSAYRPYERQVYWRNYWCSLGSCGNAAWPGTSNHGLGLAVDVPQFVRGYIDLHGQRFGWCKCWSDAAHEWWHVKFNPAIYARPNPGPNLRSPTLRKGSGGPGQNVFVRKVQKLLRGHGDKSVQVDGEFGRSTAIAVRRFQKAERIKVNGVVSKRVWKRLRQPVLKPVKTTPKKTPKPTKAPPPKKGKKHKRKPHGPAWGIDVSNNNGPVNWKAVRRDGASFAVVKATEGQDYIDPTFNRKQLQAITKAGLVPGVYHYLRPRADRKGSREAAWFTQAIGQAGYGKGFLPPVLDVEETTLGPAETCRYVGSFLRLVRKNLGVKAIVYTFPSFAATNFASCSWIGKYPLWIAHIGVSAPTIPAPWGKHLIWQYTWSGKVAGVAGDVDVDKLIGGKAALARLRVKEPPKRARLAPRARVKLPLEAEPRQHLRNKVPAADKQPLTQLPAGVR